MPPKKTPAAAPAESIRVAYHDGPPEIHFAGLAWRRGVPDTITAQKWAEMQARGDFREFDFREEPLGLPMGPSETKED